MLRRIWVNPHSNFSLRLSSGLLIFLLASWGVGYLEEGVIACLIMPALLVGGIDLPSRQWRRRIGLAILGYGGVAGATAWISLQVPLGLIPWFTVLGFLLSSCAAFGNLAARLGMGVIVMAVIGMATAALYPWWQLAFGYALATAWLTGYSAWWYRFSGNLPLRFALAATYRHLAKLLLERPEQLRQHRLPAHFDEALGEQLATCRRLLGSVAGIGSDQPLWHLLMAAVDLQERLQAVPDPVVASEVLTNHATYPCYQQWTRSVAVRLHRIARDLERGRPLSDCHSIESHTDALIAALQPLVQHGGTQAMVASYMMHNARQIERVAQRAAPLHQRAVPPEQALQPWQQWRQMMNWSTPVMRGSVRMGLMLGLGTTIGLLLALDNGYWILSTIVVVWQSTFVAMRSRAWQRVAGTFGGLVLSMVALNLGVSGNEALLLALLMVPVTLAWVTRHHGWCSTGITFILMLELEYFHLLSNEVLFMRMLDTFIGCVLIVGAYRFLWPQWQGGRQWRLRQDALAAAMNYNRLILARFSGQEVTPMALALARREAYEQGIALNDSLKQMRQEPSFGTNVNNSAALLALYKGITSNMNALVLQVNHQQCCPLADMQPLNDLFRELSEVFEQVCKGNLVPWPERALAGEQWLFQRLEHAVHDKEGFVLYQFSLMLQRFHGIHQILLMPAPNGQTAATDVANKMTLPHS